MPCPLGDTASYDEREGSCSSFRAIQLFNLLGQIRPLLRSFMKTGLAVGIIGPLGQGFALRCPLTVKFSPRRHVVIASS